VNNEFKFIDWINIFSFGIGLYALYIAVINFELNEKQSNELKEILHYLDTHLQEQDKHLISQDKILENLTKGE